MAPLFFTISPDYSIINTMSTSSEPIVSLVKRRFDHASAKKVLKEKYQAKLTFAYRGGMWRAGPELNATIFTCGRMGEVVLEDLYGNPVKIDTAELMKMSQERFNEQMNAWLVEYEQLQQQR
jgi:hypothetical protein